MILFIPYRTLILHDMEGLRRRTQLSGDLKQVREEATETVGKGVDKWREQEEQRP